MSKLGDEIKQLAGECEFVPDDDELARSPVGIVRNEIEQLRRNLADAEREIETLRAMQESSAPHPWDENKPNYWAGAWKYDPQDERRQMLVAYPDMALAYIDELEAIKAEFNKHAGFLYAHDMLKAASDA